MLRRIGAWIIGQARAITRHISWSLLRDVPIERAGKQHAGRLFRRDGRDGSRRPHPSCHLQAQAPPATTSEDDDTFRVDVRESTYMIDGSKRILHRDTRLW